MCVVYPRSRAVGGARASRAPCRPSRPSPRPTRQPLRSRASRSPTRQRSLAKARTELLHVDDERATTSSLRASIMAGVRDPSTVRRRSVRGPPQRPRVLSTIAAIAFHWASRIGSKRGGASAATGVTALTMRRALEQPAPRLQPGIGHLPSPLAELLSRRHSCQACAGISSSTTTHRTELPSLTPGAALGSSRTTSSASAG